MTLPDGIDEATMALWPQALKNYGHPWTPMCDACVPCKGPHRPTPGFVHYCREHPRAEPVPHTVPMPSPTKELLWDMLVKGLSRTSAFLIIVNNELWSEKLPQPILPAAAVIRAWASMGEK